MTAETERPEGTEAAEADDEIVVDVPEGQEAAAPEPKAEPEPRRKPKFEGLDPEDADYGERVQKRIHKEIVKRRGIEAELRREREAREHAERVTLEIRRSHLTAADAAIERDLTEARNRHERAFSEGDATAATRAAADLADLSARRLEIKRDQSQVPQQPRQQPQQPRFTRETQAYIDENPWFESDPDAQATAVRAHEIAVRRGIRPETPDYFEHVTRVVKAAHPEHFEDADEDDEPEPPRKGTAPPVVAPARRTVPGSAGTRTVKLPSLNADQRAMARQFGMTDKEYATEVARDLAAQGKL